MYACKIVRVIRARKRNAQYLNETRDEEIRSRCCFASDCRAITVRFFYPAGITTNLYTPIALDDSRARAVLSILNVQNPTDGRDNITRLLQTTVIRMTYSTRTYLSRPISDVTFQ